jgi:S-adenosylmethionine synthetase (AdoMet synthetase)
VRSVLAAGSAELRAIFQASAGPVASNDTSGASGWAPLSPTEQVVLEIEQFLNGVEFKARFPDTGQDVKVFGVREDERLTATIAMPLFSSDTPSEAAYYARKEEILAALGARFQEAPLALEWRLNNLDARGRGAEGAYLTVTGTSAEDADSGQVGRGNRANGLIAWPASSMRAAPPWPKSMSISPCGSASRWIGPGRACRSCCPRAWRCPTSRRASVTSSRTRSHACRRFALSCARPASSRDRLAAVLSSREFS